MTKKERRELCEYQYLFEAHLTGDINQFLADCSNDPQLTLRMVCETLRSLLARTRIELGHLVDQDDEDEEDA
jgi:hypothetical protein